MRKLALYLRYQSTHERAFHKCVDQLHKLRAEGRRSGIGFESQKREEAEATRMQEAHDARSRLAHARAAHLELNRAPRPFGTCCARLGKEIRSTIEAQLPGHAQIPFDQLKTVLKLSLEEIARHMAAEKAAA